MFNLFIDSPIETLKKSIEDIIIKSAGEALGKKYFGMYYNAFGDGSGLGKTYEKCFIYRLNELSGVHSASDGAGSIFDCVITYNEKKYLIQVKTSIDVENRINLARVSNGKCVRDKIEIYKKQVKDRMIGSNVSSFFLLYVSTSDGKIYLHKMSDIENGKFIFYPDKDEYFSYCPKQTPLYFKRIGSEIVRKQKVPGLYTVDIDEDDRKKSIKKLVDFNLLENELYTCSKNFKEINSWILGSEWGDKGMAYEKFVVKHLKEKYSNVKSSIKNTSIDFTVVGLGSMQLKTCATRKGFDRTIVFGRSSINNESNESFSNDLVESDNLISYNTPNISLDRRNDIEKRIKKSLIDSGEKTFHLIMVDLYKLTSDMRILSELDKDLKMTCKGSFLSEGHYSSDGGETGNQTHFRIKTTGLIHSVEKLIF